MPKSFSEASRNAHDTSKNLVCAAVVEGQAVIKDPHGQLAGAQQHMKIQYYEQDDILFIEFTKGEIVRDKSVSWNVNIGYTASGLGEITILEAKKSGLYPLQIERIVADAA